MDTPCCIDQRTGLAIHNRLDLKQQTLEFSSPECGSVNQITFRPDYCCFRCPVLKEKILRKEEP